MADVSNCFKRFYYLIYLYGLNVFPKDEKPGLPAKMISFVSNLVCKSASIVFILAISFWSFKKNFRKSNDDPSSFLLVTRGLSILLLVYLCFFVVIYSQAGKHKHYLQILYSYLKTIDRPFNLDNSLNLAAKLLWNSLLFTFFSQIIIILLICCLSLAFWDGDRNMIFGFAIVILVNSISLFFYFPCIYIAVLHLYNAFLTQLYTDLQMNIGTYCTALKVDADFNATFRKYSVLSRMIKSVNSTFSQTALLTSVFLIFANSFIFFAMKLISMEGTVMDMGLYLTVLLVPFLGCFEYLFIFILTIISAAKLRHAVSLHFL